MVISVLAILVLQLDMLTPQETSPLELEESTILLLTIPIILGLTMQKTIQQALGNSCLLMAIVFWE